MKNIRKHTILAFSLVGLLSGCSALVTNDMLKAAHQDMDRNHDGYIDFQEYRKTGTKQEVAKEAKKKGMSVTEYEKWDFNRADLNHDGKVTLQEFLELAKKEL